MSKDKVEELEETGLSAVPCRRCGQPINRVKRHENHILQYGVLVCEDCHENGGLR